MSAEPDFLTIDQKLLHVTYEKWPEYFKDAAAISCNSDKDKEFYNSLFFCGMGGSATSCDILNDLTRNYGNISSEVVRGSNLPRFVNSHSLVIVNSVSGNTEETLTMVNEASAKKAEVICISSGGKLKEVASKYGHKHISIPDLFLPRASLPYLIPPGLKLIRPFLTDFPDKEISTIYRELSDTGDRISMKVVEQENIAKRIAGFLKSGFVFCLTSPYLISAGTRFKNSLNENAKLHCTKETILESTHNEIVPFTFKSNAFARKVMFLQWDRDGSLIKSRFTKVQNFFSEIGQPYMGLLQPESSILSAILCAIYILDYSTVYIAITNGIDPSPTPAIDILKRI
jgi:glucose/mannose-6-phosphate isomerase